MGRERSELANEKNYKIQNVGLKMEKKVNGCMQASFVIVPFCDHLQPKIPSEHHQGGLRIGSRRHAEDGSVNNAKRIHSDDLQMGINHPANHAAAVVVPDGAHSPPAEIRHARKLRLVKRQGGAYEPEVCFPEPVREFKVLQSPAPEDFCYLPAPVHAALKVHEVVEVVEPHAGIRVDVGGGESQKAGGERAGNLGNERGHGEVERGADEGVVAGGDEWHDVGCGLDVSAGIGNPHDLDERMVERKRGENGDSVSGIIVEEVPHVGEVVSHGDPP